MADKSNPEKRATGGAIEATNDTNDGASSVHKVSIKDEMGDLAIQALSLGDVDPAASKRVLKKIDMYILAFLCATYALQFIDKTSLGYSSVYGIIPDNRLVGQSYSWVSSIFYFGYLFFEYPGVAILQRFPVAKFLGANIILWGCILMTTAACSSFAGLAIVRFLLGATEATISPGFVAITGICGQLRRHARVVRHRPHYRPQAVEVQFLILGAVTVAWGVVFTLFVPDGPSQVKWLTEEEKVVAVQRIALNQTGSKSRRFVRAQIVEAVTDPKIVILGLISMDFGFNPLTTTLMGLPLSTVQLVTQLTAGLLFMSKISNSRLHIATAVMIPPITGTVIINQLHPTNRWGRLVGVWLLGSSPVDFMVVLGLLSTNIAGSMKRSFFKSKEAPAYKSGMVAMLCGFINNLVLNQVLRYLYVRENKKMEELVAGKSGEELLRMKNESEVRGVEDVTDRENIMFRYVL
ncbi:major facilitator superfamily domain-containing protein [Coniochaeta sp. 2T2.1]|nr:major facilitator superfamily domain-containing protein [Coniochaeta sp. 2T2.1]